MKQKLWHGSAYYPEQWGAGDLDRDIAVMKELGLNTVRMAEFAWSVLEPEEGKYDFSLFDAAIERFYEAGISVILGTPTATPPRWFTLKYPDSLYVDENLKKLDHGSREHVCVNNSDFRRAAAEIVRRLAERYGRHPALIAWQVHNEPNCPVHECFCPTCRAKWSEYLAARYGSIEALNEAWGNRVWSFEYPDFVSVLPPVPTPYLHSTSQLAAYRAFNRESVGEFLDEQAEIIRRYSDAPVCTNVFRTFELDFDRAFRNLDFVGIDEYSTYDAFPESLLNFDRFRNTCKLPYFVMETPPTSGGNVVEVLPFHHDGYVRALAASAFLGGGNGFLYWQFRQSRSGSEMPHGHILSAFGGETPAFGNVREVSAAIEELQAFVLATKPAKAEAVFVFSDFSRMLSQGENLKEFDYLADTRASYASLVSTCLYRDALTEKDDFSGRKLIYIPYCLHVSDALAGKLCAAAREGATVVVGPYTGWRTEEHTLYTDCALGALERLTGTKIRWFAQYKGRGKVSAFGEETALCGHAAVFEGKEFPGIEEVACGKGRFVFALFKMESKFERAMLAHYAGEPEFGFGEGVCYYRRTDGKKNYHCFVNLSTEPKKVTRRGGGEFILSPCGFTWTD